ncbi:restriction endonuclease subunit S [Anabaenopsis tanganyikae CS-531]|uniref:Restriction endonuclease subunit S n=1 Tax=Anabaenopsis tanganyikae CS-531 TaxID=2785304 RepID=A0ABT6KAT8_9CYAN|nr:restriction endonuclease subunit S [Anabaenopsis tanganyikae]MDH6104812.1 restriction endonuclease subunit S [Anabaenopsis tanganyikae CS-531]
MKVDTFFTNFDLLTDAPNATAKLRELILQLAVMGKLVRQDPNDEPAAVLLERIKLEKQQMIQNKVFFKSDKLIPINLNDIPYKIPSEWVLTRIGVICGSIVPNRDKPKSFSGEFPWITLSNFDDKGINLLNNHSGLGLSKEEIIKYNARIIPQGSVLMSCVGRFGLVAVIEQDVVTNQQIHGFVIPKGLCSEYIAYLIQSQKNFLESTATSTTISYLNKSRCESIPVPLPPLAEQKRIVEKCDRLMSLCDEIEKQHKQKQDSIVRMNEGAIAQLLSSQNPDDFRHHWERICNNFDLLYSVPETIPKLRQAILQLAVMGKLVRQDPNDEPAQTLIKKIKAQKKKLIEAKKIRKQEDLSSVKEEDKVYQLPENWIWCRWNDIALCIGDVDHKMPAETKEGIPYVSPKDFIKGNAIDFSKAKKISQEDFETLKKKIQPSLGDIIFPRYGTIGENRLVETDIDFLASYSCAVVKNFHSFIEPKYSFYYSLSNLVKKEIERYTNKTTQANVGVKSIKNFIFPLPPLAEQKRIVEKCDRLMSLCDRLEAKLKQGRESREKLMEVAAKQVLLN